MLRPGPIGPLLVGLGSLLVSDATALAQDQGQDLLDPRSIGRAGTSTVSSDSGVAILHNPAGMVRRSQSRLVIGTSIGDDDLSYSAAGQDSAPHITDRAAPTSVPALAYHHSSEDGRWVMGALLWGGKSESVLPKPAFGQPVADVERLFPHRYGGTSYTSRWKQIAVGGALRIGDAIGLGASVALRDIEVSEERRIWAGFAGRDPLLGAERDLHLSLRGRDYVSPSASVGVLFAPPNLPLEFAAATELRLGARLSGDAASLSTTNSSEFPQIVNTSPAASLQRPDSATMRGGLRYLGERVFLEAGIDFTLVAHQDRESWSVTGLQVVDQSSVSADLTDVPSLHSTRSHLALRGAIDYEVLSGFLWLTTGWAWNSPSTARSQHMPAYAQLGGHRLAAGLLAVHQGYTLNVGYSRRLQRIRDVDETRSPAQVINPFEAGTGSANTGRYRSSSDQLGFALEIAW